MESQNKLAFFDNFNKYDFFSEESDFFIDELSQNGCEFNNYNSWKKEECYCPPNKGFIDLSIKEI